MNRFVFRGASEEVRLSRRTCARLTRHNFLEIWAQGHAAFAAKERGIFVAALHRSLRKARPLASKDSVEIKSQSTNRLRIGVDVHMVARIGGAASASATSWWVITYRKAGGSMPCF